MLNYPNPQVIATPDSPPGELLQAHAPELTARHAKMLAALGAARTAREAFDALAPRLAGTYLDSGPEWADARQRDIEAVKSGERATAVAEAIRMYPDRFATLYATVAVAQEAVDGWNADARDQVRPSTIKGLEASLREHHQHAISAAARALVAADGAGNDQNRRLDAGWQSLSDLDAALERWKPIYQLMAWCNGYKWEKPWRELRPPEEVIGRALALRDEDLRRQFRDLDARPHIPHVEVAP